MREMSCRGRRMRTAFLLLAIASAGAAVLHGAPDRLEFVLVGSTNLHDPGAPHMRRMSMTLVDRDHFSERWTKTEAGKDTVFELNFTRR